ncbi:MAG: glutamate racemase, partial [Gammaproteobacteria bacterium]
EIAGPEVKIIDSSAAIARELRRRLTQHDLLANPEGSGSERFWTSADPERTGPVIEKLWRVGAAVNPLPDAVKVLARLEAL